MPHEIALIPTKESQRLISEVVSRHSIATPLYDNCPKEERRGSNTEVILRRSMWVNRILFFQDFFSTCFALFDVDTGGDGIANLYAL